MGLLDALTAIAGSASSDHHGIADALSQVMQEHPGGMDGVLAKLKENGLGEQVESWIKPGENQAVSPDQIEQGLGASTINSIAERAGISPTIATGIISAVLPLVVSHLSGSNEPGTGEAGGISGIAAKLFGKND